MKKLNIKEKLEIMRSVKEEIQHYDQSAWRSLSKLMEVPYPYSNAGKILLLTKIKMNPIEMGPGFGIGRY